MSTLIIGDKQILPEKPEMVTGYTLNSTYLPTSGRTVEVKKCGNVVSIMLECSSTNLPASTVVTIGSGFPKCATTRQELQVITVVGTYTRVWIDSSGNLVTFNNPGHTASMYCGGTYICQ